MKHLSLIIPYRDREEHLKKFIPNITKHLSSAKINYSISVIEQDNKKLFNRAKLFNVGFEIKKGKSDYFCFHDVDLVPENEKCDYSFINGVARLSTYVSQFQYIERPEHEIGGGITLIDKNSFLKINGYSNKYWGWGAEDDDFSVRIRRENISIHKRYGRYESLIHKRNIQNDDGTIRACVLENRKTLQEMKKKADSHKVDGLQNLDFTIKEKIKHSDYTLYKVDI